MVDGTTASKSSQIQLGWQVWNNLPITNGVPDIANSFQKPRPDQPIIVYLSVSEEAVSEVLV